MSDGSSRASVLPCVVQGSFRIAGPGDDPNLRDRSSLGSSGTSQRKACVRCLKLSDGRMRTPEIHRHKCLSVWSEASEQLVDTDASGEAWVPGLVESGMYRLGTNSRWPGDQTFLGIRVAVDHVCGYEHTIRAEG